MDLESISEWGKGLFSGKFVSLFAASALAFSCGDDSSGHSPLITGPEYVNASLSQQRTLYNVGLRNESSYRNISSEKSFGDYFSQAFQDNQMGLIVYAPVRGEAGTYDLQITNLGDLKSNGLENMRVHFDSADSGSFSERVRFGFVLPQEDGCDFYIFNSSSRKDSDSQGQLVDDSPSFANMVHFFVDSSSERDILGDEQSFRFE
ncbi:MAG: hypothetical protein KKB79_01855 [Nanoarchaeota archaeon]|nr:hypothetical protein [Nanoarchaeota archaeon]